jgi:hypothetical protein
VTLSCLTKLIKTQHWVSFDKSMLRKALPESIKSLSVNTNANSTSAKIRSARGTNFAIWAALRAAQMAKLSPRRTDVNTKSIIGMGAAYAAPIPIILCTFIIKTV